MLTFHYTRADLLREAKYARMGLRLGRDKVIAEIRLASEPATDRAFDEHAARMAVWLHRKWLALRSAQMAMVRVRRGLSQRMAFVAAASEIAGQPMRHCAYCRPVDGVRWHTYGQLAPKHKVKA